MHKKLNDSMPEAEEYFDNPEVRFESIKQRDTLKRWQMNNSLMTKGYAQGRTDGISVHQPSFLSVMHNNAAVAKKNLSPN